MRHTLMTPWPLLALLCLCHPACSTPEPRQDTSSQSSSQDMNVTDEGTQPEDASNMTDMASPTTDQSTDTPPAVRADVTAVNVSGNPGAYQFSVTLSSTETGCEQYADWWEILTPEGALLYRRILGHSHVNEQPFTRSGGPVNVQANQKVIVRAHMNKAGYVGQALEVTLSDPTTSSQANLAANFASDIERVAPQPNGCAF